MAEKPSISKAVAGHLSGGSHQTVSHIHPDCPLFQAHADHILQHNTRSQYIKNYSFDFDFGSQWGNCSVTMTCVTGHLTNVEFTPEYKNWSHPPPESLFRAPVVTSVHDVSITELSQHCFMLTAYRIRNRLPRTSNPRLGMPDF